MADPSETPKPAAEDVKTPASAPTPAVDVQSVVSKALAEQQSQQASELKEATGYSSIKELNEARLAEQGKTQELLDAKSTELATVTKRFQDSQINVALLSAASDAVDASFVAKHLADQCQCDENGQVTVNGKTPADAVKALLEEKPFLAKAQGDSGSGAPTQTDGKASISRAEFDRLDAASKTKFIHDGGIVKNQG